MIVFDLDGTLADITHRRHFVEGKSRSRDRDYKLFQLACVDDKPIAPVIGLFKMLHHQAAAHLEIWSGRADFVRWDTVLWLNMHVFSGVYSWNNPESHDYVKLRMRPTGDTRPDAALKEAWLDEEIAAGRSVELAIDDRQRLVDMWRRRGIVCLQAAKGDY